MARQKPYRCRPERKPSTGRQAETPREGLQDEARHELRTCKAVGTPKWNEKNSLVT